MDTWLYFSPLLKCRPFLRPKSLSTDWLMISLPEITEPLARSVASSAGCLAVHSEDALERELKRPGDVTSPQSFIERNVWATNKGLIDLSVIIFTDFFTLKPEHSSLWGRYRSICTEDVSKQTALRGSRADRTELQAASLPSRASSSQEKRDEGPGGNDAAHSARQGPGSAAWPTRRPPAAPGGWEAGAGSAPSPLHLPGWHVLSVCLRSPRFLEAGPALGRRGHPPWWLTLEEERQTDCWAAKSFCSLQNFEHLF